MLKKKEEKKKEEPKPEEKTPTKVGQRAGCGCRVPRAAERADFQRSHKNQSKNM